MEQLRHRLTNVSPQGQRRSVDQNTLKRSDLDDLESPASPAAALRVACYNPKNRHYRKERARFKSFTYEELTKRDKVNLNIFWLKDAVTQLERGEAGLSKPRRQRQPPRSRRARLGNHRRPRSSTSAVRRYRGGFETLSVGLPVGFADIGGIA